MIEKNHHPDLLATKKEEIYYNLVMFPYPSGFGLHVGHASNYTITDVNARFQRMLGRVVLNPFGFDSFGLPTENYAMKQGKPAYEVTKENTDMFLKQIEALNMSFDMERLIYTSNPDYYKWTQWIFSKLYQHGLVYRDELYVNRCPECQTVLANDQVVDNKCERCGSTIILKKHPQRFIKITDYAERLIKDLDLVDRPEETKVGQKNRIGYSQGAEIDFTVTDNLEITCFTTRPDTLYGVTALVLAPENTSIDHLLSKEKRAEVEQYRQETLSKTAVQRQQEAKEKSGIFSEIYAQHPLTKQNIPIRFADYILADYGSGAVMMVPAHDQRDREFAKKYNIDIIMVINPINIKEAVEDKAYAGEGVLINSDILNGLQKKEAIKKITEHLQSIGKGRAKITYKLRDRSVSRQRYRGSPIPIYYTQYNSSCSPLFKATGNASPKPLVTQQTRESVGLIIYHTEEEKYVFIQWKDNKEIWMVHGGVEEGQTIEEAIKKEIEEETGYSDIQQIHNLHHICRFQRYVPHKGINRDGYAHLFYVEIVGQAKKQSKEDDQKVDVVLLTKEKVRNAIAQDPLMQYARNYYITNKETKTSPANTTKIAHLIPEEELPVVLPLDIKNYKPKGKSPLEDHPTFPQYKAKNGKTYRRECDTLDTFMCSSFYFLRYPDANNPDELIGSKLRDKLFPVDFYCGGKEHTVGHLLYARFIHKFLYDIGYLYTPEPFQKLVHQGMVLGPDGRKMSKRRGNIIDPLDVIKQYNADVLRMYLMFMGPVEADKARDDNGVRGIYKFLQRVEKLHTVKSGTYTSQAFKELTTEQQNIAYTQIETLLHKTIKTMTEDMKKLKYNTAISKLMIVVNKIYEVGSVQKQQLETLVLMLAPFATELAKNMWEELGHKDDIEYHPRPRFDETKIVIEQIDLPVQINGKMRGTIVIEPGTEENKIVEEIRKDGKRGTYLQSKIKKVIFVQDKIINIII